jgi:hypothetical protein
MKIDESMEVMEHLIDVLYTLDEVFGQKVIPGDLIRWARPAISNEGRRTLFLHEDPLYVAASFLNLDSLAPEFRDVEKRYFELRRVGHAAGTLKQTRPNSRK